MAGTWKNPALAEAINRDNGWHFAPEDLGAGIRRELATFEMLLHGFFKAVGDLGSVPEEERSALMSQWGNIRGMVGNIVDSAEKGN